MESGDTAALYALLYNSIEEMEHLMYIFGMQMLIMMKGLPSMKLIKQSIHGIKMTILDMKLEVG